MAPPLFSVQMLRIIVFEIIKKLCAAVSQWWPPQSRNHSYAYAYQNWNTRYIKHYMRILLFSNIEVRVTVGGSDYYQFHEREIEDSPTIRDSGRVLLTSMGSEPITQNKAELQNCMHNNMKTQRILVPSCWLRISITWSVDLSERESQVMVTNTVHHISYLPPRGLVGVELGQPPIHHLHHCLTLTSHLERQTHTHNKQGHSKFPWFLYTLRDFIQSPYTNSLSQSPPMRSNLLQLNENLIQTHFRIYTEWLFTLC